MRPPADEAPTEEELEVVQILRNFPNLVLEAESRRIPDFLRWGARRRRYALDDNISFLDPSPLPPPPPPSISHPLDGNDERKDRDRGDAGGAATLSPAAPFSFPASGREKPEGRPPRPPCSTPAKKFKKTNRNMAVRESMTRESQKHSDLAPLSPLTLQSPATRSSVDLHNQRWEIQPPPPADRFAGCGTPSPSVVAAGPWPEKKAALDLNASAEGEEDGEWKRSSAYKAAMSAQARKRRLEIQREKNSHCASPTHPLFSMARKMRRLR